MITVHIVAVVKYSEASLVRMTVVEDRHLGELYTGIVDGGEQLEDKRPREELCSLMVHHFCEKQKWIRCSLVELYVGIAELQDNTSLLVLEAVEASVVRSDSKQGSPHYSSLSSVANQ